VRDQLIVRVAAFLAAQKDEASAIAAIVKAAEEQFKTDEAAATAATAAEAAEDVKDDVEPDKVYYYFIYIIYIYIYVYMYICIYK
jgi:hypothetical protein